MERRKKVTCLILSCFILLLNISIVKAEALPEVMNGSATIADCVMSYYAMAGAAVANSEWIQTLYDGLGSSFGTIYDFAENGLLTINNDGTWQATTALTDAIENNSAYTSLGLDDVFNISSAEAAAGGGVAAASGAATLSGAVGGVASAGVLPVLGGVTAAYWGGIGIGTLCNHLFDMYCNNIVSTAPITIFNPEYFAKNKLNGDACFSIYKSGNTYTYQMFTCSDNLRIAGFKGRYNQYVLATGKAVNVSDFVGQFKALSMTGTQSTTNVAVGSDATLFANYGYSDFYGNYKVTNVPNVYDSQQEYNTARNKWFNGTDIPPLRNYSPDIVGENGNQRGSYDSENGYSVPDIKPQIDTGTQAGVPLTMQDWLNFANSVSNNNSNTNPLPDNSALFDALIDRIVTPISNPNPDPDPDPNPDPYHPPVVTPVPDPDYDPVPDNPDQPDYESEKQKQTEPVPDEIPTGAPWTTDGLLDKFPFCIPKDMIDMVKQFSTGSRQAPYISWRFNPPGTPVDYTFNLDLSDFEDAATLIRMLELAAFVVGLAFATRYIIGAT